VINRYAHRLVQLGIFLFLIGLLTGFAVPFLQNPRMALSSHLEAVLNGIFLVILGIIWPRLQLNPALQATTFGLVLYGTFANWLATLLAAIWGAGATSMPIAAGTYQGSSPQETLIAVLLFSLSAAMIVVCSLVLWGLRSGGSGAVPGFTDEQPAASP